MNSNESSFSRSPSRILQTTMDFYDNSYYKMNKQLLSAIGHWPYQSPWKKRLNRFLITVSLLSIAIPEIIQLTKMWGDDWDYIIECIPPLGLHLINLIKWFSCFVNNDKLKELLILMEAEWKSRENGHETNILREYAERGRILTVGYTYFMFVSAALYNCLPLMSLVFDVIVPLNESRPLEPLFHTEYFVDQDKFFFPIFFHNAMTTFISMTIVVAFDTMYGAYIQYACSILTELGRQLEKGEINKDESLTVPKDQDYTHHHIVECVKKHQEAIAFCELMESTYTGYFFFVTGVNVLLMSFTGLQAVMRLDDVNAALRYGTYTLGQVVHVFFGCWHGQLLIDHSLNINESTQIYYLELRVQRHIVISTIPW